MNEKESVEFLNMVEVLLGASAVIEGTKEKPNMQLVIENILALQVLHWKRLGYDVKVKFPKDK